MKIEMGESLVRTWMRHCKGCQFAELNWKPSPVWDKGISPEHEAWYEEAKTAFSDLVLKKTSGLKQFLGQAEVDVLGVGLEQGRVKRFIASDIAFHSLGLVYGSKERTAAAVGKKMLRSALVASAWFPGVPAEILFLSPKVYPATMAEVRRAGDRVAEFFASRRPEYSFRILANQEFRDEVLEPVLALRETVADTSELFLRAAQLLRLCQG